MTKGTYSFGRRHTKSHTLCRRCGNRSYHIQKHTCSGCGYPAAKTRSYNWSVKAMRRTGTGTGRTRYLKTVHKRFNSGFKEAGLVKKTVAKNFGCTQLHLCTPAGTQLFDNGSKLKQPPPPRVCLFWAETLKEMVSSSILRMALSTHHLTQGSQESLTPTFLFLQFQQISGQFFGGGGNNKTDIMDPWASAKSNVLWASPSSLAAVQQSFDPSRVPTSVKNSQFINLANSNNVQTDPWMSTVSSMSAEKSMPINHKKEQQQEPITMPSSSILGGDINIDGISSQLSQQFTQLQIQQQQQQQQQMDENGDIEEEITGQSRYKTELCRSFQETGICRYGFKCQFAHGRDELRPVMRHPKYKTETCKTFHTVGSCPYGARCRFIHSRPNAQQQQQLLLLQQQQSTSPDTLNNLLQQQIQQQEQHNQAHLLQLQKQQALQQQQQQALQQQQQQPKQHQLPPHIAAQFQHLQPQNSSTPIQFPQQLPAQMQTIYLQQPLKTAGGSGMMQKSASEKSIPTQTINWTSSWSPDDAHADSVSKSTSSLFKSKSEEEKVRRLAIFRTICSNTD
eukprot:gene2536-2905_t